MTGVVGCSELVTLAGARRARVREELRELGIVRDGGFLIRDGRIVAVGGRREIEDDADEVIDAGGRVVMPGFVDAHTHPVFAGNRADEFEMRAGGATYREIAERGGGIRSTVRRTRAAGEDELAGAAARYAQWFLRSGTTTIEAKSGYGLSVLDEVRLLRVIQGIAPLRVVPTFLGAHEVPDEFLGRRGEYLKIVIEEMLPRVTGMARFCDVFCEAGVFSVEDARRVLTAARGFGLRARMHVDQLSDGGGARLAAELGAATADHLEYTDASGFEALRDAGVQPVLLPGAVYGLGSRKYPDARGMIAAGLGIVLATDFNPGSSPTASMPMMLSLASTQMKMTVAEGITASTINAAYSLGLGGEIGSLEVGKSADFVIHDCRDHRELGYFFGMDTAREVYIRGERVYAG